MRKSARGTVGRLWVICVFLVIYPTAVRFYVLGLGIKAMFIPKITALKNSCFPHIDSVVNRLFFDLPTLPTGLITTTSYLNKLITIGGLEET